MSVSFLELAPGRCYVSFGGSVIVCNLQGGSNSATPWRCGELSYKFGWNGVNVVFKTCFFVSEWHPIIWPFTCQFQAISCTRSDQIYVFQSWTLIISFYHYMDTCLFIQDCIHVYVIESLPVRFPSIEICDPCWQVWLNQIWFSWQRWCTMQRP